MLNVQYRLGSLVSQGQIQDRSTTRCMWGSEWDVMICVIRTCQTVLSLQTELKLEAKQQLTNIKWVNRLFRSLALQSFCCFFMFLMMFLTHCVFALLFTAWAVLWPHATAGLNWTDLFYAEFVYTWTSTYHMSAHWKQEKSVFSHFSSDEQNIKAFNTQLPSQLTFSLVHKGNVFPCALTGLPCSRANWGITSITTQTDKEEF